MLKLHPPRDFYKALLLILLLSIALRALFSIFFPSPIISDAKDYDSFAKSILHYHIFGENGVPSSDRPPLYPFFLALLYLLPFPDIPTAFIFQIIISSLTVIIIYLLGRRHLGERGGFIAGLIACFTPDYLFFSSALLTETLFIFLFLLGVYIYEHKGSFYPLLSGILFGFSALTRPEGFIFGFFFLFSSLLFSKNLKRALITFLFSLLTISPWIVRNTRLYGQPCFITTTGGGVFWMGNNPRGKGGYYWREEDNPLLNPDLTPIERDRLAYRLALKNIASHPLMWLKSLGSKTALLLNPIPDSGKTSVLRGTFTKLGISLYYILFTEFLFILSFAGMVGKINSLEPFRFIVAVIAIFYILVMVEQRFRAPLLPFLNIFAASTISLGVRKSLTRKRNFVIGFLFLQIALFLFALLSTENRYLRFLNRILFP